MHRWIEQRIGRPPSFVGVLPLAAGFLGFVAWDQSHWWRTKEDYAFGWLVPLFVGFVLHDRWPKVAATLAACAAAGSPRVAGARRWLLHLAFASSLGFGILMFLLGSFYRAGAGPSQPGTLAITLGAVAILLPLIFLHAPAAPRVTRACRLPAIAPPGVMDDPRVRLTGLFLFPVLVWLVSAPMVSAVEAQLNLALLRRIVTVVAAVFETIGAPLEQQGNVLVLPGGRVGVEEACSGIRSLTGCLLAGSFLAAVLLDSLAKKILLIGSALALAVATNLVRSLVLTGWAYRHGPAAIGGWVHDVAGFFVLGFTTLALLGLVAMPHLPAFRRSRR